MASRSKAPARPRTLALAIETVKWLVQNSARRSANGRCVVAAVTSRARVSACTSGRKCSANCRSVEAVPATIVIVSG
jgi:hypothetical protein